jgi:hypothetical protein
MGAAIDLGFDMRGFKEVMQVGGIEQAHGETAKMGSLDGTVDLLKLKSEVGVDDILLNVDLWARGKSP